LPAPSNAGYNAFLHEKRGTLSRRWCRPPPTQELGLWGHKPAVAQSSWATPSFGMPDPCARLFWGGTNRALVSFRHFLLGISGMPGVARARGTRPLSSLEGRYWRSASLPSTFLPPGGRKSRLAMSHLPTAARSPLVGRAIEELIRLLPRVLAREPALRCDLNCRQRKSAACPPSLSHRRVGQASRHSLSACAT
jgi:hypothetical protein